MSDNTQSEVEKPKSAFSAAQQNSATPLGWKATWEKPVPVQQCTMIKKDGTQCKKWGVRGTTPAVCTKHGAQLPAVRKAAEARVAEARTRMMGVTPDMFEILLDLTKPGVSEGVRLKAATEIMDRAGLKPGMELNVTVENVSSPLDDISKQLTELASHFTDLGEVQDAEVIDEEVAETQDSTESPSS